MSSLWNDILGLRYLQDGFLSEWRPMTKEAGLIPPALLVLLFLPLDVEGMPC